MARPYIVLNGIHSNEIEGLIISTLPPISKPEIRVNKEEIDGVDGDIVTVLGYSAYDKEFEIGLSYNYDIDEVIQFFNSSGTVTFSNEEHKYYNYQIFDQIDFEKLVNFKTAKVKMHVQPFKYSVLESEKTFDFNSTSGAFDIRNNGNIYSRPILTITGSGTINLSINGVQLLVIYLDEAVQTVVIDTDKMNAYNPENNAYMNRHVSGDYDKIQLNSGKNSISFTGNVTEIKIDNYSRWI